MSDNIWVKESPLAIVEGAEPVYTLTVEGASTIASPSVKIYKGGQDVTSTNMTGSASTNGTTNITLPKIVSVKGGNVYVVVITATINGIVEVKKMKIYVQKPGDEV